MEDQPKAAQARSDQVLLRGLLRRSTYASSDFFAEFGSDYEREMIIINRLRKGMIIDDVHLAAWDRVVVSEVSALLRWENEGGSPADDKAVREPSKGEL